MSSISSESEKKTRQSAIIALTDLKYAQIIKPKITKTNNSADLIKAEKSNRGRRSIAFSSVMRYAEFLNRKFQKYVSESNWKTVNEDCKKEDIKPISRNTFKRCFLHLRECTMVSAPEKHKIEIIAQKTIKQNPKFTPNLTCELCKPKKQLDKCNLPADELQKIILESNSFKPVIFKT